MKLRTLSVLSLAACAAFLGACATSPQQQIALAGAEAGNAYATYELSQNPNAVQGLQDLAAALPNIPLGKVSATQLGVIQGELNAAKAGVSQTNAQLQNQIGSLISLVTSSSQAYGGIETADQALYSAACQNVAAGITNAIAFYQGEHSVPASVPKG